MEPLHTRDFAAQPRTRNRPNGQAQRRTATARTARPSDHLRPDTSEPPATWRDRRIQWVTGELPDIIRSLPRIVAVPVVNRDGVEHRLTALMACRWPPGGALSTPARTQWSDVPTGAGASWPPPTQPTAAARAFRTMLDRTAAHGGPTEPPTRWTLGIADDGEWFALRASWPENSTPEPNGRKIERWIQLEHATHWNELQIGAGVRDAANGAMLPMHPVRVIHENRALADAGRRLSSADLGANATRNARAAVEMVAAWDGVELPEAWIRTWASAYVAPIWGAATAAEAAGPPGRTSTAADAAWRIASADCAITDLDERTSRAEHLCAIVEELTHTEAARPTGESNHLLDPRPEAAGIH